MEQIEWYQGLSDNAKGWVGQVLAGGTAQFISFLQHPDKPLSIERSGFDNAPIAAAHAISLAQTVQLIRVAVDSAEPIALSMVDSDAEREWLREQLIRYGREVAFAAALVYARVAEQIGANQARANTDLIEGLVHGEPAATINQLATRLGIDANQGFLAAAYRTDDIAVGVADVERATRRTDRPFVVAAYDRCVVALWPHHARESVTAVARQIFPSQASVTVAGPSAALAQSHDIVLDVLAALTARRARPTETDVLFADDLLPERALIGEVRAQGKLQQRCFTALDQAGGGLVQTVDAMLAHQGVLEQAARSIPVHVNTLRYRLDRIEDITGYDIRDSRGALALQIGFTLARVQED